ncbi:hypothetical protein DUZ99_01530 [Xylanibacillus composti]|uniref:Uncharacterized protein n=1 Tax=Xylanibacillus composti TaxID=1572762 RepID=A0A8J4H8N1_9BACL|nr:hypothetical protein [Xylanibacillus composti]MDT9723679.1 hypothetical protein [Xylanibacillus composti]GIQ71018.1 hypothetical protein XYCOK13_38420 [Xylanibacillus composti]
MIAGWEAQLLYAGAWLALSAFLFGVLALAAYKPGRMRKLVWNRQERGRIRRFFLAWQERLAGGRPGMEAKGRLLRQGGVRLSVRWYLVVKHVTAAGALATAAGIAVIDSFVQPVPGMWMGCALCAMLIGLALADQYLLQLAVARRQRQITSEIYMICRQLLYYRDSRMNLHSKLMRCQGFMRVLSGPFRRMLNAWYEHPEHALQAFKEEVGIAEAHSFVETLNTMRMGESEKYYRLLQERAEDYKDKLEMAKEGMKETRSYVLFVLAGIPILNTFWVFLYPWVREGEELFYHLNY